ncbi:MAG: prepilin peptidase [Planctomycetales bacterium]|nr:prepilin peptidase [Planctomycetales bacterium]
MRPIVGPVSLVIAIVAALVAGQINRAIYCWAWNRRSISPWSPPAPGVAPRTWRDRIPIIGWWWMRRESSVHGTAFWVRPALIELSCAVGSVVLYQFELSGGLLPIGAVPPPPATLQVQAYRHLILIALMLIATFIDLDEKTIPDEVTVLGSWLGLTTAIVWPDGMLSAWSTRVPPIDLQPLWLTAPGAWDAKWDGTLGLSVGLFSVIAWWYALLPKTLWYRGGMIKFLKYLIASILRHRLTYWLTAMAVLAAAMTGWVWHLGGERWAALLSAWMGLVVGGAIVWSVRVVGSLALQQEAMGFGDVTLLAMIGTFIGWQPTVFIFFMAPFTGVLIAVLQWLFTGRKDMAYGPFLCLATLVVLLAWPVTWSEWAFPILQLGSLLLPVLVGAAIVMGVALVVWRMISARLA